MDWNNPSNPSQADGKDCAEVMLLQFSSDWSKKFQSMQNLSKQQMVRWSKRNVISLKIDAVIEQQLE